MACPPQPASHRFGTTYGLSAQEQGAKLEEKIEEGLRDLYYLSPPFTYQCFGSITAKASRSSISDLRTYVLLLLEPDPVALSGFPVMRATVDDQELHGSGGGPMGFREAIEALRVCSQEGSKLPC